MMCDSVTYLVKDEELVIRGLRRQAARMVNLYEVKIAPQIG